MKKVIWSFIITALLGAVIFMLRGYFKSAVANISIVSGKISDCFLNANDFTEEYTRLYAMYEESLMENQKNKRYREENQKLRELLEIKNDIDYSVTAARVLSFGNNTDFQYILADKGMNDGVHIGDCVIAEDGFVGIVYECGESWCGINTLYSDELNLSVSDTENGKAYLLSCGMLEFVSMADDIGYGDLLVTSGVSESIPKGIKVGRVFTIKNGDGAERSVKITPETNYGQLGFILILTEG